MGRPARQGAGSPLRRRDGLVRAEVAGRRHADRVQRAFGHGGHERLLHDLLDDRAEQHGAGVAVVELRANVKELVTAIRAFIDRWNDRCHPFTWTKTADEILPHATGKRDSDARH